MSKIYLVDDHAIVREGLKGVLGLAGHEVVGEAETPTAALAEIPRVRPDVVILDLRLRERSGFEVLTDLRSRAESVRVIVLTMSTQPRHVAEALKLGAKGYVLKSSLTDHLINAVADVAAGRLFLCPQAAAYAATSLSASPPNEDSLSEREKVILGMVARGFASAAIGEALHLSPKTVDTYRSRMMAKLQLPDIAAVVRWAIRKGLVDLDD